MRKHNLAVVSWKHNVTETAKLWSFSHLMVLVFLGAWYVAGIDQHVRHCTVWAPDGRVWHNVTMDRNFAGDLVLTNSNGEKTTVSKSGAAFTYDRSDWYLGLFA
jgi:hypothetical protein